VCLKVENAFTFFARFRGLMFRAKLLASSGLLLSPCNMVHMCFMRFPIDVVFVDRYYKVVGKEVGLKPWTVSKRYVKARYALELPAGWTEAAGVEIGDVLEFM